MTKLAKIVSISIAAMLATICFYLISQRLWHNQLDRRLLLALHQYDSRTALMALAEGADPNARDLPERHPSLLEAIKSLFRGSNKPIPNAPTALLVAVDWRWREATRQGASWGRFYTPANPPHQDPTVIRAFLEHGANVNAVNEAGLTPLQIAAWEGNSSTVQLLLEYGASDNINRHTNLRWSGTPLTFAISADSLPTVQVLVRYHADINTVHDGTGYTALELARLRNNTAIIRLLEQVLKNR